MSTFDPSEFLNQSVDGPMSTSFVPVPEGDYTAAIAGDPEVRQWTGRQDPSKTGLALDLEWEIDDPMLRQELARDRIVVKQGIMLDLNTNGGLDTGKGRNVQLGRLREATGLNSGAFNFRMLAGKMAKVSVKHRVAPDGQVFAEVKGVAPLA